jgi:hypothetical protein
MRSLLVKCTIQPSLITFDPRRLVCFTDCTMRMSGILLLGEELYSKKLEHVTSAKVLEKKNTISSSDIYHSKTVSSVLQFSIIMINTVNYLRYNLKKKLCWMYCHLQMIQILIISFIKDQCLLRCDAIQTGRKKPLFQRNLLSKSSQKQAAGETGGREGGLEPGLWMAHGQVINIIKFRITGISTLSIIQNSESLRTQRFRNWVYFCPHVRGGDTYSAGSLTKG